MQHAVTVKDDATPHGGALQPLIGLPRCGLRVTISAEPSLPDGEVVTMVLLTSGYVMKVDGIVTDCKERMATCWARIAYDVVTVAMRGFYTMLMERRGEN